MHPLRRNLETRDDVFLSRYAQLRDLALKLSNYNLQEAEDLLHDSFIYFTLCQTPVENIDNLDAYLYTMLRNLRLSRVRRLARLPQNQLSLIDYDSAEVGLSSVDPRDQIRIQDELRAICRYAVVRKESAKAGSVLILRFFHGYLPTEIAAILRVKRSAVDNLLQIARREARLYNADPSSITFLAADKLIHIPEFRFGQLSDDILTEVKAAIFHEPTPQCPIAWLSDVYTQKDTSDTEYETSNESSVDCSLLAHIVSCQPCLNKVNNLLGIPDLNARVPTDTQGSDKTPKSGGGRGNGGTSGKGGGGGGLPSLHVFAKLSRKRLKQIFEHQPEELHISVNGFIIGSQKINSELNELALSVNLDEKIGFIEVFSDRDVCLLFQSVQPPPEGPAVQPARVELSGGRVLELSLDFSETWPRLNASYADPSFSEVRSPAIDTGAINRRNAETQRIEGAGVADLSEPGAAGVPAAASESGAEVATGLFSKFRSRLPNISWTSWLQPAHLTAAFAILLIAVFAIWKFTSTTSNPPLTASDLLAKATAVEQQLATAPDVVIHKTVDLEERNEQGVVVARRKIDRWSSGEQRLSVRRLYDEQGKLLAGEWNRADGSRTLYTTYQKAKSLQTQTSAPVSIDEAWMLEPSAQEFQRLSGPNANADVQESANTYTVSYKLASDAPNVSSPHVSKGSSPESSQITDAAIKFSKDDLRVIEQILTVRSGDQQKEYRYTEASYVRHSPQSVSPNVFEPEKELLGNPPVVLKKSSEPETTVDANASVPPAAGTAPNAAPAASADLEVEALNLLNQAGADTGEQINVTRGAGLLKIDGVVETETRKNELLRALSPIASNAAVRINILTVAEAVAREEQRKRSQKGASETITSERFDTGTAESPVQAKLRSFFGSDDAANSFSVKMIGRSRGAMSHAGALKRLVNQFKPAELATLSPDARAKWLSLIRSHARAFQQETAALRQELSPVFGGGAFSSPPAGGGVAGISPDGVVGGGDAALIRAVERLFDLGAGNDRMVRNVLSISNERAAGFLADFFRNLRTTEDIAQAIQSVH
jgi:RNA polymerase sigma factor (sigma-70 family)